MSRTIKLNLRHQDAVQRREKPYKKPDDLTIGQVQQILEENGTLKDYPVHPLPN